MAIDCGFVVGYGGSAIIQTNSTLNTGSGPVNYLSGIPVYVLSASVTRDINIPMHNSFYLPNTENTSMGSQTKSPIRGGFGTYTYSGQISFELSRNFISNFLSGSPPDFIKRDHKFNIIFFDGENSCTVENCVWSNIQISSSANNISSVSISFLSTNGHNVDLKISSGDLTNVSEATDYLVPYWQTGIAIRNYNYGNKVYNTSNIIDAVDFNLNFERSVSPIFLNNKFFTPTYLRPGLINVNLSMNTLTALYSGYTSNTTPASPGTLSYYTIHVNLYNKAIQINNAVLKSESYQNSNLNDIGNKSYQFISFAKDFNNTNEIIEIVNSISSTSLSSETYSSSGSQI